MDSKLLLAEIKKRLVAKYGDRLKGVVLYGSEARGDAEPDSDIDLLVLLEGELEFGKELMKIIETLYDLQLQINRPLHARPVDDADFKEAEYAFYRNVLEEGKLL